jgi:hypothetical protein
MLYEAGNVVNFKGNKECGPAVVCILQAFEPNTYRCEVYFSSHIEMVSELIMVDETEIIDHYLGAI